MFLLFIILLISCPLARSQENDVFPTKAPGGIKEERLLLKTDILPWGLAIPTLGAELSLGKKWSVQLDLLYCPWKISDRFSVKTFAILPEARWWLKTNEKGSFFNIHLNVAWFNVRANAYRYQDAGRPLLGGGIGYGYRFLFNKRWGLELEIGAGVANTRYQRFYNINNGALKDTRISTFWGIDRATVAVTYYLCDI